MRVHSSSLKKFPGLPKEVPDTLFNEEWAQRNHDQTLKRLNERGGLGVGEMLDNIHKRKLTCENDTIEDVNELLSMIEIETNKEEGNGVLPIVELVNYYNSLKSQGFTSANILKLMYSNYSVTKKQ